MIRHLFLFLASLLLLAGCGSSAVEDAIDDIEDAFEVVDGLDRKPITYSRMGVNAFANQMFAGGTCAQYQEIKNTLGLNFVRVLFNWDDNVQPTPNSSLNFSFYDQILSCIPDGMDALVILTSVPSWMNNSDNWVQGNPRLTFARKWAKQVAQRYAGNSKIRAYQVWNEPNNPSFGVNSTIQVLNSPENYIELVSLASNLIKNADGGKTIVSGATTAIAQNYPDTLNYNKSLVNGGILSAVDIFGIHYYGTNLEAFLDGVRGFLNSVSKPIWVTESGRQGVNNQLAYAEQIWPYLRENVPGIGRIYYYRFAENTPADVSYGLRTPDEGFPVSDLYIALRDR